MFKYIKLTICYTFGQKIVFNWESTKKHTTDSMVFHFGWRYYFWCRGEVIAKLLNSFFLFFVCQMCNSNYASSIVLNVCTVHMSSHVKCLRSTHLFRWTNGWTISRIRIRFGMSQQKSHAKSFISTKAKEKKRSNSRVNSTLDLTRYTILMMRFIFPELDKIFQEI